MTLKVLSISALMLGLAAGAAYAQTTTEPDQTAPSGRDNQSTISNRDIVGPMYLDEGMTKMRPKEEMKAEWVKLSDENRKHVQQDCMNPQNAREKDFCDTVSDF